MLQKKDSLKPYDIIVFDPKAHRRNVLKEKRFENKDILKDGDNNTKTMSTNRKVVSWLSKENESNKIVSVNERSDNHRSNLKIQYHNNQKNCTNKSKEEKRSKGFEFVAEIHTPLNPKITAGHIIGPRGEYVKELSKLTSCFIIANDDHKNGTFCAEVCSNDMFRTICGADVLFDQLIFRLGHHNDSQFKQMCYFRLLHNDEHVQHEYISWRIHLPMIFGGIFGFVVGPFGDRHRQLTHEIDCRIEVSRIDANACVITIKNEDVKKARNGTYQMLMLRKEFGDQIIHNAKVEGVNLKTHHSR
jgi:hypothetical protein